jgi:hypothetical protein
MNKREVLHERGFSAVPIVARPFNPFGGRDDHDYGAGRFSGRAHLNAFFATGLLHLNRWSNDHRRYILPPTLTHQSIFIGSSGGGGDSHDSSAGCSAGHAHWNGFFVTRKKFKN